MLPETSTSLLSGTIGAYECGVMAALFMYGLIIVQAYSVLRSFPKDSKKLKYFIIVIWCVLSAFLLGGVQLRTLKSLLEGFHSLQLGYSLYWLTIVGFGKQEALSNPLKRLCLANGVGAFTTACIQTFFAYRVHMITNSYATPFLCTILATLSFAGHIILSITGIQATEVFVWERQWLPLLGATLGASAAADILIAANLCFGLWKRKTKAIRGEAHMLVDRVIAWSLETCLLTSVCTIVMLILLLTMENFAWLAVSFNISRLFSNSFLASLKGRKTLRKKSPSQTTFVVVQKRQSKLDPDGMRTSVQVKLDLSSQAGEGDIESGLRQTFEDESTETIHGISSPPFPRDVPRTGVLRYYQRRRSCQL